MTILTTTRLIHLSTTSPHLSQSWYFIAAATLTVCNQPQELPLLYHYAMQTQGLSKPRNEATADKAIQVCTKFADAVSRGEQVPENEYSQEYQAKLRVVGTKMREAILKTAALSGLPKCINSLMTLKETTPKSLRDLKENRKRITNWDEYLLEKQRGIKFWEKVYGKISNRVIKQMSTAYPDLWSYTIENVYSPLLSFTGCMSAEESSLVVISCLIPQDVNPQLKGHLKGALNNGCTLEEVRDARQLAMEISSWCGITWKSEVAKL
ncbi:unnamed protein product [Kuraishia capsulata CBS 1993]|uniref:Uncharacterized protein n=1 Tax=Kuraishia capsulata CBS 1993 TaxID=1382522 RepID=W6MRS8_9ASCO|nr:uncharacterized protein KUCA_T00000479001 [Kuraishia capsulata CBS 1993]CDK24515.1 unnamed protein product [Kuraishia capsulata CBS 1993]